MATAVGLPGRYLKEMDASDLKYPATAGKCMRCGGLMVVEPRTDFWDNAENSARGRCVQCGEVIDPVILRNRRHNRPS